MKIITITLCPAFDIHCYTPNFAPYHENLVKITDYDACGKGVNISRALMVNGVKSLAIVAIGEENGDNFKKKLVKDGLTFSAIPVGGRIRENITLHTNNADETRISFEGFSADKSLLDKTAAILSDEDLSSAYVTFTGRVPSGIDMADVKDFLRDLKGKGAKVVIDSRSFELSDLVDVCPWLIKPNQEEISVYLGKEINSFEDALSGAREFQAKGINNVMISLGPQGALLVSESGAYSAVPPKVDARSTIGAGDSSIGGFLAAAIEGENVAGMLRRAVSYGTAACMTEGTRPPRKCDVETVYEQVKVTEI